MRSFLPLTIDLSVLSKALLGVGLAAALAVYLWPIGDASGALPSAKRFDGEALEVRATSAAQGAPFVFASGEAPAEDQMVSALPALVGIAGQSAYVRGADGGVVRIRNGEEVDGWRLVRVGTRWIELSNRNDTMRVELFAASQSPPTGP